MGAAALMKLCAYPDAIRDCEECLKLDPKFVKAHARKGQCYAVMKDYNKAVKAFQEGLAVEPNDAACQQGMADINNFVNSRGGEVDEAQVQQAMKDPEIQKIMHGPQIQMVLKEMQANPKVANEVLQKDPQVPAAVQKLMLAGIIKLG